MNTLFFFGGMGVGALCTIFFVMILIRYSLSRSKKWNQDTLELMQERNEIARSMLLIQQERLERGL